MTSEQFGQGAYFTAIVAFIIWSHNAVAHLSGQPIPMVGWVLGVYIIIEFIIMLIGALRANTKRNVQEAEK